SIGRWIDVARFGAVPTLLAVATLRLRMSPDRVRSVDLGLAQTANPQQSLAAGMDDPSVRVGFPRPGGTWIDPSGEPIVLGGAGRSVTRVEQGNTLVAAVEHDPALDDR